MGARVPFVRHGGESPPPLASSARPKCHDFRQHDLWRRAEALLRPPEERRATSARWGETYRSDWRVQAESRPRAG